MSSVYIKYTNNSFSFSNTTKLLTVLVLLLFFTQFFSYVDWDKATKGLGLNYLFVSLIFIAAFAKPKARTEYFHILVMLLAFYPIISAFMSLAIYGQPIVESFKGLIFNFTWLFYFVLNRYRFRESTVIKALLVYSLVMLAIMIIQQFTYPIAFFGIFNDDVMTEKGFLENVSMRNGIYRFTMHQNGYTVVPVLLFYLACIKKHFSIYRLVIVSLMISAVYMSLTRQVIASCLFVVFLSLLINKKSGINVKYLIVICIIMVAVYGYSELLFGEMAQSTKENLNKDYIRLYAYSFYWDKICENGWTFLFGHGLAKSGEFLRQFNYWQEVLKLYTCDVGIIGVWFHYGFIYVALYLYSLYLIFCYRRQIPIYVILFTIFAVLMSIMIFPFWITPKYYFVWTLIFYICDLHINKSPLCVKMDKDLRINDKLKRILNG